MLYPQSRRPFGESLRLPRFNVFSDADWEIGLELRLRLDILKHNLSN